jgi:hypothetical protein
VHFRAVLPYAGAELACSDELTGQDMLTFPINLSATDATGVQFLRVSVKQPHPVTADGDLN